MNEELTLSGCKALLADLVAHPSVTGAPFLPIQHFVTSIFDHHGISYRLDWHPSGTKANIFATIGPEIDGGIILSGHLDVVPADPEGWSGDPFRLREIDGRLTGRGAVDMKGFVAAAVTTAIAAQRGKEKLERPLHIALTFDEEIGCHGAKQLQGLLESLPFKPEACIVGEPTAMQPIIAHRGSFEAGFEVIGRAGHASDPRTGVNAIYFAAKLVSFIEAKAQTLAANPRTDIAMEPPYTTLSVGRIEGGEARNIIPDNVRGLWELRALPGEDGWAIVREIERYIDEELRPSMKALHHAADVRLIDVDETRGLHPEPSSRVLALVQRVTETKPPKMVSFNTDAGYFQAAGISTIVMGPGDLAQAHQPDEFIRERDLSQGLAFLDKIRQTLHGNRAATLSSTSNCH